MSKHFPAEFTQHIGRSYSIVRANDFDTHAVAIVAVDGKTETVCYSMGRKIRKVGPQYRPVGSPTTFSTLDKALRFCALAAAGHAADFAADLACCA